MARIKPLDHDDVIALTRYQSALFGWRSLLNRVFALLDDQWGHRGDAPDHFRLGKLDFWRQYEKPGSWPEDSWFEFHARMDDARFPSEKCGGFILGSGAVFPEKSAPCGEREWVTERVNPGRAVSVGE